MQEMATPLETDDNIAVMWVPDSVPPEGLRIAYRMHVAPDMPGLSGFGHAVATRLTRTDPRRTRVYVDFALPSLPEGALDVVVSAGGAEVRARSVVPNAYVHGVRATFDLERPDAARDVELRAYVKQGEHALTETWSYRWPGKS
jgi:periplasmic glucans biosynthesis protein